jgi:hypothetical protein
MWRSRWPITTPSRARPKAARRAGLQFAALSGAEVEKVLTVKAAGAVACGQGTGAANVAKLKGTLADFQMMIGMSSASAVATVRQGALQFLMS